MRLVSTGKSAALTPIIYIKEWEGGIRLTVSDRSVVNRSAHEESMQLWEATPLQVLDSLCRRSHSGPVLRRCNPTPACLLAEPQTPGRLYGQRRSCGICGRNSTKPEPPPHPRGARLFVCEKMCYLHYKCCICDFLIFLFREVVALQILFPVISHQHISHIKNNILDHTVLILLWFLRSPDPVRHPENISHDRYQHSCRKSATEQCL